MIPSAPSTHDKSIDLRHLLSTASRAGRSSAIRDLLVHARSEGVISLAGGLPSPDLFPAKRMATVARQIFADPSNLQYGLTEGEPGLREWIADHHVSVDKLTVSAADVQIVSGSQQALDMVARVMIDPGDPVVVGESEYLGAIGAFRQAGANLVPIPIDEHGIDVDRLEARLLAGLRPKIIYLIPEFHNPTGATITIDRLHQLARLSDTYGFLIIEDNPYGALRFEGEPVATIAAMTSNVVICRTISKTLAPGLRVAWMVGPEWLINATRVAKQSADLHTPTVTQHVALALLNDATWMKSHIDALSPHYARRRDALVEAVGKALPSAAFHPPTGGMFLWLRFPSEIDTDALLTTALDHGVAYVPGSAFNVAADSRNAMRLSYATASPDQLRSGVARLAEAMAASSHFSPPKR